MKILSLLILVFMFGCETDIYPDDGEYSTVARDAQKDPADALSMIVDGIYEFKEGVYQEIRIRAQAPEPYEVDMTVENLPLGATFDKEKLVIGWKPGFFDGNELGDPSIKTQTYTFKVWLRSTDPDSEVREKEVSIIVTDVPQEMTIDGYDSVSIDEGKTLSYEFEINNKDYPQGPFSITTVDLPANAKIEAVRGSTNKYRLVFSPGYHHVKLSASRTCVGYKCLVYTGKIRVLNPANHIAEKKLVLNVLDSRLKPKIVLAEEITQGLDTSFQVAGFDLNDDNPPKIEMLTAEPEYGDFELSLVKDFVTNSSTLNVKWSDIPTTYNGQTLTFDFQVCAQNKFRAYSNCITDSIDISIKVKDRKPPKITRYSWRPGEIKYLNFNDSESYYIKVVDGDRTRVDIDDVQIFPEEMRKYVSFSKNYLKVQFKEAGIHQFSIVATSAYNMSSSESFVAEVFPKDRSRTLYFTDSTRTPEVAFYKAGIKNIEIMNPAIQQLNDRNLSGRDNLIIGTDILIDKSMGVFIEQAMKKIENVVIASPLIENMPQFFMDELQLDHHIAIAGRYNELPNTPKIETMQFIAREDFATPKNKVSLNLKSSRESRNPLLFSVGVDRVSCEDVLDLTDHKKEDRYKIGVICDRSTGGRYAILGTEFSDIKTTEVDTSVPRRWLTRMLTSSLNTVNESEEL